MISLRTPQSMADKIVPISDIQRRARKAFEAGQAADSCPFNWHSAAYATWHEEYRRLEAQAEQQAAMRKAA